MDPFKNAPLRYRFDDLSQARAHVVDVENRALFFFRHKDLELVLLTHVPLDSCTNAVGTTEFVCKAGTAVWW